MIYFAQLDQNNIVVNVVALDNGYCVDSDGQICEQKGIKFCKKNIDDSTEWVQTSSDGEFRVRYAGIGYTYDTIKDAFIPKKPYESWIYDETSLNWVSPIGDSPERTTEEILQNQYYYWDEDEYQNDLSEPKIKGWILTDPKIVDSFDAYQT